MLAKADEEEDEYERDYPELDPINEVNSKLINS